MSERAAPTTTASDVIDPDTRRRYRQAGFGKPVGLGRRPALLVIDVQYRTTGTRPLPFERAIAEFPTSCGRAGWDAVAHIARLLAVFRQHHWPVLYPHVAAKNPYDSGRLGAKVPTILDIPAHGYDFVEPIAPRPGEVLVAKRHPSAFFGTPLTSYLIDTGADTLVITGCTTSGCIRASVVDAFSHNYRVAVPEDAVYDRSPLVHEVNLFDMAQKYADITITDTLTQRLDQLAAS